MTTLSYEAWVKAYRPEPNHTNEAVSYYEKGKWVGVCLELTLRLKSGGKVGVLDLFKALWSETQRGKIPITADMIYRTAGHLAGGDLRRFFKSYVEGVRELPFESLVKKIGYRLEWKDRGDQNTGSRTHRDILDIGMSFVSMPKNADGDSLSERFPQVRQVVPDGPGWAAGLTFKDEIVAANDVRVKDAAGLYKLLRVGQANRIHYFRDGLLLSTDLTPVPKSRNRGGDMLTLHKHAEGPRSRKGNGPRGQGGWDLAEHINPSRHFVSHPKK